MSAPKLLDLFCGAMGAGEGYHRAGFDVTGVDLELHPDAPHPVIVADACQVLTDASFMAGFDVVHASPPCQGYTTMSNRHRGQGGKADGHQDLISWVRLGLQAWGGPYAIENVPGARSQLRDPITLHGGMFGLGVQRPRLFESNVPLATFKAPATKNPVGVYGKSHDGRRLFTRKDGSIQRAAGSLLEGQLAMGISWMSWDDLREAIPPAYTEFLGRQLLDHLAGAEGCRMTRRPSTPGPQPGVAARYEGDCPRCGFQIHVGTRICYRRGVPIHVECASGATDD